MSWWRIWREVARARVGHVDHHLRRDLAASASTVLVAWCTTRSRPRELAQQLLRVDAVRLRQEARPASRRVQRVAVAARSPRAGRRARARPARGAMRLNRPKSRNATRPSASSMKLPGWGSPENWRWRYRQPKKKRKTISPMRSRSACGRALSSSKPAPLTNSLTITRSRESELTTSGTTMNGWPREDPRHRALVLGLELVVELLVDPHADLLGDRLDVEARAPCA